MPLDPSIIMGYKPVEIQNPMDIAAKGMSMKNMAMQNQTAEANLKRNEVEMNHEQKMRQLDMGSRIAMSITDQASYTAGKQEAMRQGLDVSQWGDDYDPIKVRRYQGMALSAKEQLDNQYRDKQLVNDDLNRKEMRADRWAMNGQARQDRLDVLTEKKEEKIQGLKTPYGLANTTDDAKQLKEAHESKKSFDSKLQEMIALRKKYGAEYLNRNAVGRGKQLSKDLLLEYKNMAKLGVLSQSDNDIINAIIPDDPLAQDWAPGQDPILHKLEKFQEDKDQDFQTRVQTRTRSGIEKATSDFDSLSDEELLAEYNRKFGNKNANAK